MGVKTIHNTKSHAEAFSTEARKNNVHKIIYLKLF